MVVFLTSNVPRWTPRTEANIRQAIADGILEESHWWDAKREVSLGKSANRRLAADMAAFAIDGGSLLVGLAEDKESGTFSLAPGPTAGMAERIANVAATAVDPPLYVIVTPIPAETPADDGSPRGYLLIEVPPSASAPHQVDHVYWGRGDKQNVRLTDADVHRQHVLRESLTGRGRALLAAEVARDPFPIDERAGGHIYLVADPLTAAPDAATRFLRDQDARDWVWRVSAREDVVELPRQHSDIPPLPQYMTHVEWRADGMANTSTVLASTGRQRKAEAADAGDGADDNLLDVEFLHNGGIRGIVGRATRRHKHSGEAFILDQLIVAYTRRLLQWTTKYADAIGYRGSWVLGVHIDGLAGLSSALFANQLDYSTPPRFSAPAYESVTTATLQELVGQPWAVTERLIGNLVWSLGTESQHRAVLEAPAGR